MKRLLAVLAALLIGATAAAAPAFADEGQPSDSICYKLSGEDYTQVVCEDPDGNRISVTTYFNDGCSTTQDASGESSTCKEEKPELDGSGVYFPNDIACDSEVLSDAEGVEYKLVTCRNVDGTLAWQARYTQDGCVTQVDADGGEFTSCPEVQPWLPPTTDISCESEPWADDSGVEYKLVTCRDADGNVVSRTRYAQDGCETSIDADGIEQTSCPTPVCTTTVDAEGNEGTTCPNINIPQWYPIADYTTITSVKKADDGCWTIERTDGSTELACPDSTPSELTPALTLDERGCIVRTGSEGEALGVDCPGACYFVPGTSADQNVEYATCYGGNTPEDMTKRSLAFCDVQLLQVDGQSLTLGVCDDGCTLVNGMPTKECSSGWLYSWGLGERTTLWVSGNYLQPDGTDDMTCWSRAEDGTWTSTECVRRLMYDKVYSTFDGDVIQRRTAVDVLIPTSVSGLSSDVAFASAAPSLSGAAERDVSAAKAEQEVSAEGDAVAIAYSGAVPTTVVLASAASSDSVPTAPVSPTTAALALAGAGAAGLASSRVRLRLRRR